MAEINPYVFFDGNCAAAMRFYEQALGGKIELMMTHAESPAAGHTPPGNEDRIIHARLVLPGGGALLASDAMASEPYPGMHSFAVSVVYATVAEAQRAFDAVGAGGKVTMPFGKTFWAEGFGMLTDRFGMMWMFGGGMASM